MPDFSVSIIPELKQHRCFEQMTNYPLFQINKIETARPIVISRKNWLFAGSEQAGRQAAAIQRMLATAKANDIEPLAWLKGALEKLPTHPNSRIDELLPLRVVNAL
jgi:transposase